MSDSTLIILFCISWINEREENLCYHSITFLHQIYSHALLTEIINYAQNNFDLEISDTLQKFTV